MLKFRKASFMTTTDVFADDELGGSGTSLESVLKERNLSSFAESYTSIVNAFGQKQALGRPFNLIAHAPKVRAVRATMCQQTPF